VLDMLATTLWPKSTMVASIMLVTADEVSSSK
jgi:hypothetical protein